MSEKTDKITIQPVKAAINVNVQLDGIDLAKKLISDMSSALQRAIKGIGFEKYWKDQASLIADAEGVLQKYNNELKSGYSSTGTQEELLKTINALKAVSKTNDLTGILDGYKDLVPVITEIEDKNILFSNSFSVSKFSGAFEVFRLLEADGTKINDIFSRLTLSPDIEDLQKKIQELNFTIAGYVTKTRELESELNAFKSGKGIEELKAQIEHLEKRVEAQQAQIQSQIGTARDEFEDFLRGSGLSPRDSCGNIRPKYTSLFEAISNGKMTARQAIAQFRTDYLFRRNVTRRP